MTNAFDKFTELYKSDPSAPHLRLGQFFCNLYIRESWPELYYEADDSKAAALICDWLERHQYTDSLPKPQNRIQLPH
jgi:hypothetical protein